MTEKTTSSEKNKNDNSTPSDETQTSKETRCKTYASVTAKGNESKPGSTDSSGKKTLLEMSKTQTSGDPLDSTSSSGKGIPKAQFYGSGSQGQGDGSEDGVALIQTSAQPYDEGGSGCGDDRTGVGILMLIHCCQYEIF